MIERLDMALHQIETILTTHVDSKCCQGQIFPQTIETLQQAVVESTDTEHKNRLINILVALNSGERMAKFDLFEIDSKLFKLSNKE